MTTLKGFYFTIVGGVEGGCVTNWVVMSSFTCFGFIILKLELSQTFPALAIVLVFCFVHGSCTLCFDFCFQLLCFCAKV